MEIINPTSDEIIKTLEEIAMPCTAKAIAQVVTHTRNGSIKTETFKMSWRTKIPTGNGVIAIKIVVVKPT